MKSKALAAKQPKWHWYALLGVVFFEYLRPQDWILSFLAPLRLAGIVTLLAGVIFLLNKKNYLREDKILKLLLIFLLVVTVTILFAPNTRAVYNKASILFWTFVAFVFPVCAVIFDKERLYKFFLFWLAIQSLLAIYVATHAGHGPGSYLFDENDAALAINMAIPYALYMYLFPGFSKKNRFFILFSLCTMVLAVGITASRGAVVGLGAIFFTFLLLSEKPIRNAMIFVAMLVVATPIVVSNLPPGYLDDMENMSNPEDKTRDERIWSWSIGWVMFVENPILGVGAGNYEWTNHLYAHLSPLYTPKRKILGGRAAHSLYFTLLPELGFVGTAIYCAIVLGLMQRYRKFRSFFNSQQTKSEDLLRFMLLYKAVTASAVAFLITGAFITVLYYPPFWHLVGLSVALYRISRTTFPGFKDSFHLSAKL